MVEPLRHRQTKGAATDMFYLTPPRHISTLPRLCENSDIGLARRKSISIAMNKKRIALAITIGLRYDCQRGSITTMKHLRHKGRVERGADQPGPVAGLFADAPRGRVGR